MKHPIHCVQKYPSHFTAINIGLATWPDDDVNAARVPLCRDVGRHVAVLLGRAPEVLALVVSQPSEGGGRRQQSHHCAGDQSVSSLFNMDEASEKVQRGLQRLVLGFITVQGVQYARVLSWVDLNFECSTVCPILPGLVGIWQKRLAKMEQHPNLSQPNPGPRGDGTPCKYSIEEECDKNNKQEQYRDGSSQLRTNLSSSRGS